MGLPKLDAPTYRTVIPSTKTPISIRPFLVKEQKILLTAVASEDYDQMIDATKQVVTNCILTPGIDVDKLELFDLEFLILQLRIHSVGEKLKIRFMPIKGTSCAECSKHREQEIDLREAQVHIDETNNKKIELTDKIGVLLTYPRANVLSKIEAAKSEGSVDKLFEVIWACVDAVYDDASITSAKDVSIKEGVAFLESLNSEQFLKIEKFFENMPKLKQTVPIKCASCDFKQDYVLTGLENFFV